jgi:hypothetical protein
VSDDKESDPLARDDCIAVNTAVLVYRKVISSFPPVSLASILAKLKEAEFKVISDSALERQKVELNEKGFVRFQTDQARLLSTRLLSLVHPFLARNFLVRLLSHMKSTNDCRRHCPIGPPHQPIIWIKSVVKQFRRPGKTHFSSYFSSRTFNFTDPPPPL